jgi:dTDP-glucose 4,6-dehydratase
MNVLVTGGAGFIGSNFVRLAATSKPNWKVTVLDKLTYAGNLASISELIRDEAVTFVRGDIADNQLVSDLFSRSNFDLVFNFAAESHVDRSLLHPEEFVKTNVLGTQVLLSNFINHKRGRFIQVSTDEVYGSLGATGVFYENTPLDPSSPYSASKAGADQLVIAAHRSLKADVVVTRCTNNYGAFQFPEKFLPLFISNAIEGKPLPLYGNGQNVRSWIHVHDHNRAVFAVAEKGVAGEVYNIGPDSDGELPNISVAEQIILLTGAPKTQLKFVTDRPGHDLRYAVDSSKLRKLTGWKPQVSFRDGLKETVDWYRSNKEWVSQVKSGEYLKFFEQNYGGRGI